MPTTTALVLRQRLSEYMGDYRTFTATGGSTTTLVDASLAEYAENDDAFPGWWVAGTSGDNDGVIQRVKGSGGYTASSTTLTVAEAAGSAWVNTNTFELHRYSPTEKRNAINRAIERLYPILYLPLRDETLIVDSILLNGDFETTGSPVFESWSAAENGATASVETSTVFHGTNSLKVISHASTGAGRVPQTLTVNINEVAGQTLLFTARAWSATADEARLTLSFDGGSTSRTGTTIQATPSGRR